MLENKITIKFADYEIQGDHVDYKILVKESNNQTWQVNARYSRLREVHKDLKKKFGSNQLPEFPPKTLFKNLNTSFISQRQKALENYFSVLLRKYNLDDLEPLKLLIKEGKKVVNNKESIVGNKAEPTNLKTEPQREQVTVNNQANSHIIDKIIEKYSAQLFDLKDMPTFPDPEDIRTKIKQYQQFSRSYNFNISWNIPAGSEANLISIQDETLLTQNHGIVANLMIHTLDQIKNASSDVKFLKELEIVARFKQ